MLSIYRLIALRVQSIGVSPIRAMSQTSELVGKKLVWVDCEMTGLDVTTDRLLEVAVIVTNGNLDTVGQRWCLSSSELLVF